MGGFDPKGFQGVSAGIEGLKQSHRLNVIKLREFSKHATPTALVFVAIFISVDITCRRHFTPMGLMGVCGLIFFLT
jgi:hypothetical protein